MKVTRPPRASRPGRKAAPSSGRRLGAATTPRCAFDALGQLTQHPRQLRLQLIGRGGQQQRLHPGTRTHGAGRRSGRRGEQPRRRGRTLRPGCGSWCSAGSVGWGHCRSVRSAPCSVSSGSGHELCAGSPTIVQLASAPGGAASATASVTGPAPRPPGRGRRCRTARRRGRARAVAEAGRRWSPPRSSRCHRAGRSALVLGVGVDRPIRSVSSSSRATSATDQSSRR